MRERILIVEDETDIADLDAHHVKQEGFSVDVIGDGLAALNSIKRRPPTLIVLDLTLRQLSGFDVCREVKKDPRSQGVFVVILSAKTEEVDRVLGFELDADDYMVKPFSPRELVFRIRAILRLRPIFGENRDCFQVGELVLDCSSQEVRAADRLLECTVTEFNLLRVLTERQGTVQDRGRLMVDVWGYDSSVDSRTMDTHIRKLREKLGSCAHYV